MMMRAFFVTALLILAAGCGGAKVEAGKGKGGKAKTGQLGRVDGNSRCEVGQGMREAMIDLNQDEVADVRKVYATRADSEILICREADLNFDGLKDIFVYFDEDGGMKSDEVDLDFDGTIDIVTTYVDGKVVKQEIDTNSDAVIDRVRFFDEGVPARMEGDTDGDGKVDYWEYYQGGKLIRVGMDTDGDGRADNWSRDEDEGEEEAEGGGGQAEGGEKEGEAAEDEE
jgi:hypothetical protein